jgi:hypothetical protein
MRYIGLVILLGTAGYGQALVEHAAAAAGGSVGGIAGKKVSDGLTTIFEKLDKTTSSAAKTGRTSASKSSSKDETPLLDVKPGVVKGVDSVPPPPPLHHASVQKPAPPPQIEEPEPPAPPPPPPPEMTAADLRKVSAGMNRDEVLQMGAPAARITMFDDGHLVEVFRYTQNDSNLGTVRLSDGAVSSVQVK